MAKSTVTDEVQVLRFFEQGPIEKVEVVFNIVCEKRRERLRGHDNGSADRPDQGLKKRQRRADRPETLMPEPSEHNGSGA